MVHRSIWIAGAVSHYMVEALKRQWSQTHGCEIVVIAQPLEPPAIDEDWVPKSPYVDSVRDDGNHRRDRPFYREIERKGRRARRT
jgi:hypothetical protein